MGKGVVCPFFSNYLFATSRCKEKEAVDKMIAHFVTAPFYRFVGIIFLQQQGFGCNYRINIAGSLMGLFKNNCLKIFNI